MTTPLGTEEVEDRLNRTFQVRAEDMAPGDGRGWDPDDAVDVIVSLDKRRDGRIPRRQKVGAVAASVLALAGLIIAGLWAQRTENPTAELTPAEDTAPGFLYPSFSSDQQGFEAGEPWDPPPAGDGTLPALTIDGLQFVSGRDHNGPGAIPTEGQPEISNQVFRQPDNFTGPTVHAHHQQPCDPDALGDYVNLESCLEENTPFGPDGEPDAVIELEAGEAQLWAVEPATRILIWTLDDGGSVRVETWNMTTADALAFADGLELQSDGLGFEATVLPQGIKEANPDAAVPSEADQRTIKLQGEGMAVGVWIERGDEQALGGYLRHSSAHLMSIEQVEVLGRPAALIQSTPGSVHGWSLVWRHTDDAVVRITFPSRLDREQVDQLIAGIRELDDVEWQSILG